MLTVMPFYYQRCMQAMCVDVENAALERDRVSTVKVFSDNWPVSRLPAAPPILICFRDYGAYDYALGE